MKISIICNVRWVVCVPVTSNNYNILARKSLSTNKALINAQSKFTITKTKFATSIIEYGLWVQHNPTPFLHSLNYVLTHIDFKCRNPTLAKCGGEAQHFQSWGFGVLQDSRMFRVRQQGPKHLALRCSWCHWKVLEA
jgi:hypothetical protein